MLLKLDWYRFVSSSNKIICRYLHTYCERRRRGDDGRDDAGTGRTIRETANNPHKHPEIADSEWTGSGCVRCWEGCDERMGKKLITKLTWNKENTNLDRPPNIASVSSYGGERWMLQFNNGSIVTDFVSAFSVRSIWNQVEWNEAWQIPGSSRIEY